VAAVAISWLQDPKLNRRTSLNSGHHQPPHVGEPVCLRHPGLPTSTTCRGRHSGSPAQRSTGCQQIHLVRVGIRTGSWAAVRLSTCCPS